jgi:hypothetical protein
MSEPRYVVELLADPVWVIRDRAVNGFTANAYVDSIFHLQRKGELDDLCRRMNENGDAAVRLREAESLLRQFCQATIDLYEGDGSYYGFEDLFDRTRNLLGLTIRKPTEPEPTP